MINTVPPLLVIPAPKMVDVAEPESVPPERVTIPVRVFAPALVFKISEPFEMLVVPLTVKAIPPVVMVPPDPETVRLPLTPNAVVSAQAPVPLYTKFPNMFDVKAQVLVLLPLRVRL